jgi:hypothetical protein
MHQKVWVSFININKWRRYKWIFPYNKGGGYVFTRGKGN